MSGLLALAAGCSATDTPPGYQIDVPVTTADTSVPAEYTPSVSPAPLYTPPAKPSITAKPKPVVTHKPGPKATTRQAPPPAPEPPAADVYYPNCDAARAAGVTPIMEGQPGYRSGLDRDHDGEACE